MHSCRHRTGRYQRVWGRRGRGSGNTDETVAVAADDVLTKEGRQPCVPFGAQPAAGAVADDR
jgi:hypothetical protein